MALQAGTRIDPYEITGALGVGGMGEVYRAVDTNLGRQVAIKVLPDTFANDSERLARFEREAKTLASLNHPNIAQIHGFEKADGIRALVMELVEGPTLADRIAQGPIPLDEALPIAKQIAEALEAAHEQGIVHRDLKPANIKLRPDGAVKVLDFGLAKALEPIAARVDAAASPTITSPALMTAVGMLLGTAAYMSPEQARGKPVDKRTDIWAFGCVLYEMLTGQRAFGGEEVTETLASVVRSEPAWDALPANSPAVVGAFLRRCLQKNPKQRLQDIGDMRLALEGAFDATAPRLGSADSSSQKRSLLVAAASAFGAAVLGAALTWMSIRSVESVPPRVTRLLITSPPSAAMTVSAAFRDLAITPDGSRVIYLGNNATQLFVRALDSLEPVAVASGFPRGSFVSPDGQWIGFSEGGSLKKVPITGGPSIAFATTGGNAFRGASWGPGDVVVFATNNPATGLMRAAANGGMPEVLTKPNQTHGEADHLWPRLLPDGTAALFTITAQDKGLDAAQVAVINLRTGEQKVLIRGGSDARYVPGGHLVYVTASALVAVTFDMRTLEVTGPPVPVVPQIRVTPDGAGDFDLAADGTLVYMDPSAAAGPTRTLSWVDRSGHEEPISAPPRAYADPSLSPDATRVALHSADQGSDLWVWDLRRTTLTRLTSEEGQRVEQSPVWTADNRRIIYASDEDNGRFNLWWQQADGTAEPERIVMSPKAQFPSALVPGGTQLVLRETAASQSRDLMLLTLDPERRLTPLVQTPFDDRNGVVSPDRRWLAYESNSSGQFEIFVRPFPDTSSGQWRVSTAGGVQPLWSRDGRELFFLAPDGALMSAKLEPTRGDWNASAPMKILEGRYYVGGDGNRMIGRQYDVSADGKRFLMIKLPDVSQSATPSVVVVQNWRDQLKRLVPTN